jgi:excisionase family DNA binding protein
MPFEAQYVPASAVQARYGISDMTLYRWLRDAELGFPQPLVIRRRRLFRREDLDMWDRSHSRAIA